MRYLEKRIQKLDEQINGTGTYAMRTTKDRMGLSDRVDDLQDQVRAINEQMDQVLNWLDALSVHVQQLRQERVARDYEDAEVQELRQELYALRAVVNDHEDVLAPVEARNA